MEMFTVKETVVSAMNIVDMPRGKAGQKTSKLVKSLKTIMNPAIRSIDKGNGVGF